MGDGSAISHLLLCGTKLCVQDIVRISKRFAWNFLPFLHLLKASAFSESAFVPIFQFLPANR